MNPKETTLIKGKSATAPFSLITNDTKKGNDFLRAPSTPIKATDRLLKRLISRMRATLGVVPGVGLAAPQVGVRRRVILVRRDDKEGSPFEVYVNPVILSQTPDAVYGVEGCLSVPDLRGVVPRASSIELQYQTPEGIPQKETLSDWTARIFQHEMDHLDGVLFVDKAQEVPAGF